MPFKMQVTKLENGDFLVETNVFMSDGNYQKGICALAGNVLSTSNLKTKTLTISPFRVALGIIAFPIVSQLQPGETRLFL